MSCQIKDGKYLAPNGQDSKLYKDLVEKVGENRANDLFIFAYSKITDFKNLDENGEPNVNKVLKLATQQNASKKTLTIAEQVEMQMQFPNYENSIELLADFENAFYNNGQFSPTKKTLTKSLYSEFEAENLLSDLTLLSQVKDSIERLKNTQNVEYSMFVESKYKSSDLNMFGKFKTLNPYIEQQDLIEKFGGIESDEVEDKSITTDYKRIPVIDEDGNAIVDKIIYPNAVKLVEDLDNITEEKLLDYGIDAQKIRTDVIMDFLQNPSEENTARVNKDASQREKVIKTDNQERDLVFLETIKTEEQLFREQNLVQTEIENVYHRVEKVDEQELRDFLERQETVTNDVKLVSIIDLVKSKENEDYIKYEGMFSKISTGTSYDDIFQDNVDNKLGYFFFYKRQKASIVMMSPNEYLKRVREGFNTDKDENITENSRVNILNGVKNNNKINMPFINTMNGRFNQEGRNRATVANEMGENLIPVMLLSDVKNRELEIVSENMVDNFFDNYNFNTKEELLNTVSKEYNLHRDAKSYIEYNILNNYTLVKDKAKKYYLKNKADEKVLEHELYKQYYNYTSPIKTEKKYTSINADLEYLKEEFVADFNAEILKNPIHEFYNKFEINEKGINLKYSDPISLNQIEAYLEDGIKLGEELKQYSTISKNMPNFNKEITAQPNSRLEAVNNINSLKTLSTFVTPIDKNSILAKNETEQFVNYNNEVFELKNKEGDNSVYMKLNTTQDVNYFQTEVETQEYVDQIKIKQGRLEDYTNSQKNYKKQDLDDNFNCV